MHNDIMYEYSITKIPECATKRPMTQAIVVVLLYKATGDDMQVTIVGMARATTRAVGVLL